MIINKDMGRRSPASSVSPARRRRRRQRLRNLLAKGPENEAYRLRVDDASGPLLRLEVLDGPEQPHRRDRRARRQQHAELARDGEREPRPKQRVEQQQGRRDGRVGRPEHGDEERGERVGAGDQLPDGDADRDGEQREEERVEPDVADDRDGEPALPLGGGLERDLGEAEEDAGPEHAPGGLDVCPGVGLGWRCE